MQTQMDMNNLGIRPIQKFHKEGRTTIIYGPPGIGKTTLLNTLKEKTLLMSVDCGERVLKGDHLDIFPLIDAKCITPVDSIKKFELMVGTLLDMKEIPWGNVVIDNVSELQDVYNESLQYSRGIKYPRQVEYRDVGIEMKRHLRQLRNLNYRGVNVIYIAWEDTNKIEDSGGEVMSEKIPMIMGKSCKIICGLVDFVMAMRLDKKGNRFLQLDSDYKYLAKKRENPGQVIPSFLECPKDEVDTLHKFFDFVIKDTTKEKA